jgi:hypothetical protein
MGESDSSEEMSDGDLRKELIGKYEQEDLKNEDEQGEDGEQDDSEIVRMGKWASIFRRASEIEDERRKQAGRN